MGRSSVVETTDEDIKHSMMTSANTLLSAPVSNTKSTIKSRGSHKKIIFDGKSLTFRKLSYLVPLQTVSLFNTRSKKKSHTEVDNSNAGRRPLFEDNLKPEKKIRRNTCGSSIDSKTIKLSQYKPEDNTSELLVRRKMASIEKPSLDEQGMLLDTNKVSKQTNSLTFTNIVFKTRRSSSDAVTKARRRASIKNEAPIYDTDVPVVKVNRMSQCIRAGQCEILGEMLNKEGPDILPTANLLLHQAAYTGCIKCCSILYKYDFPLDIQDNEGWTPLHVAVISDKVEVVRFLLHLYTDVNVVDWSGLSPLHIAVYKNNINLVKILVNSNADVYLKRKFISPFKLALYLNHEDILEFFKNG